MRPVHVATPMRVTGQGRTALVPLEDYLRGLVESVLFTKPGERVNRPDFGSGIAHLVFSPVGDEIADATRSLVQGSLQRWLGDLLVVEDVMVEVDEATLRVTVSYLPLGAGAPSGQRQTLTVSSAPADSGAGP